MESQTTIESVVNAELRSGEPFAAKAERICDELLLLLPLVASYKRVIQHAAKFGQQPTYDAVRYGLDAERLLRACCQLLSLVVDMWALDPSRIERKES